MGTWGSSLYSNDTTSDVRDSYMSFLLEEFSNQEAYEKTLEDMHELIGDFEEPLLWYALAETQWKIGRLMPEVKEKALHWIEKDGGIEMWSEHKSKGSGWKKTLAKLKEKLESPMRNEKKIRKPVVINQNLWNDNDVYAYKFKGDTPESQELKGKYMLIQKTGEKRSYSNELLMCVRIYNKVFEELPTLNNIEGLTLLPINTPEHFSNENIAHRKTYNPIINYILTVNITMAMWQKKQYPEEYLTLIGNIKDTKNQLFENNNYYEFSWRDINEILAKLYNSWQGVEYDDMGDGTYMWHDRE